VAEGIMGNNSRNHQIFSVLLNESDEGISFAVASAELQKSIAAWARAGKVAVFDYLDMPEEKRNYTFSNIEPVFIYHPDFTSYLFFNTQEALKTRQDYITLNFSRDLLIRTHKNIIFFVTKEVYENVVRIAHDLNSSIMILNHLSAYTGVIVAPMLLMKGQIRSPCTSAYH
jgi:hypothetical protein